MLAFGFVLEMYASTCPIRGVDTRMCSIGPNVRKHAVAVIIHFFLSDNGARRLAQCFSYLGTVDYWLRIQRLILDKSFESSNAGT